MSSIISGIANAAITLCDIVNAIDAIDQMRQRDPSGSEDLLHVASLVNKVVLIGFSCAEHVALGEGASSDTLCKLKTIELIPRVLDASLQRIKEMMVSDGSLGGEIRWLERGCIAPVADVIRVISEANIYYEKSFLEMTPEQRAQAKRPIPQEGYCAEYEVYTKPLEYKPIDVQECQANLEYFQNLKVVAGSVRVLSEAKIASTLISGGSLYENLASFLQSSGQPGAVIATAPQGFNLLTLGEIPAPLHPDAIFSRYICPITQMPIRHPVGDPTSHVVYERQAILNWLRVRRVSPMTRLPLFPDQLVEKPGLQALIDHRLRFHEIELERRLAEPVDQQIQERADRENPHL